MKFLFGLPMIELDLLPKPTTTQLLATLQQAIGVLENDATHIELLAGSITKHAQGYQISTTDGHVFQADNVIEALLVYHQHYAAKGER